MSVYIARSFYAYKNTCNRMPINCAHFTEAIAVHIGYRSCTCTNDASVSVVMFLIDGRAFEQHIWLDEDFDRFGLNKLQLVESHSSNERMKLLFATTLVEIFDNNCKMTSFIVKTARCGH